RPYPTLRGIQVILQELGAKDPKAKAARPEQFVEMSFLKELDASGAIDRLYKATPVIARSETGAVAAAPSVAEKGAPSAQKKSAVSDTKQKPEKLARTSQASSAATEHTVVGGDTLSHLALQYYGNARKWPKIYEANKDTMANPHYIYIGQKIIVPADTPRAA
ncbi:MAG TPA: LysM peptidoglycan-binding domain-containing protein, partial [Candidatus Binatia bacterium]|nr:LysM peptidoglycan-binding domain-containing protein [Candidatus Binatia bacterium]